MPPAAGPHVHLALSGHGWGHTVQAGIVVRALRRRVPDLRLTIRGTLPEPVLDELVGRPYVLDPGAPDVTMAMRNPVDVDAEASHAAYLAFHDGWEARVAAAARHLAAQRADLVLTNIAYLPLAAAARLGIPAFGASSLEWATIYRAYCGHLPGADRVHAEMVAAYAAADAFLAVAPGMPGTVFGNARPVGPLARIGHDRRRELPQAERLVVVSMGGMAWRPRYEAWPAIPGTHYIVHAEAVPARPDMTDLDRLGLPVPDLLRSVDVLVTKPGYGFSVEAACNGTAVLYVPRGDWPEEPFVLDWLHAHARALAIPREAFLDGTLAGWLDAVLALPGPAALPRPTGAEKAAGMLATALPRRLPAGGEA